MYFVKTVAFANNIHKLSNLKIVLSYIFLKVMSHLPILLLNSQRMPSEDIGFHHEGSLFHMKPLQDIQTQFHIPSKVNSYPSILPQKQTDPHSFNALHVSSTSE